jgi:hypothetical protein
MPPREQSRTLNGILKWSVKSGEVMTHVGLDGGRYNITEDRMSTFYELASHDIQNGSFISLAELRTKEFPLFIDWDVKLRNDQEYTKDMIINDVKIANSQIAKFFPPEKVNVLKTIILTAEPRELDDNDIGMIKYGIHIHYPKLIVDAEMAIQIRSSIIAGLELLSNLQVDWKKAFDCAPYGGGGSLRMIGAPKANPCDHCKGNQKVQCYKCRNTRYLEPIPSYYKLCTCLTGNPSLRDEEQEAIFKNTVKLLMATTVRTVEGTLVEQSYSVYKGCPIVETVFKENKSGKPPKIVDPEKQDIVGFKAYEQIHDQDLIAAATQVLQNYAKPHYKNAIVSTLKKNKAGNVYVAGVTGEGRNYCLKQKRDHRRNRVFMKIKYDKKYSSYTVCMGCPDDDCKGWESRAMDLGSSQRKQFFKSVFENSKKESSFYQKLAQDYETNKKNDE